MGSFLLPTGAEAVQSTTTFTSSFSTSTNLTEKTVEVDQCAPSGSGVVAGSRTQTGSSTSDTVTTEEITTLEETVGPGTVITGDRDAGGTVVVVPAGTVNYNDNTNTHTEILRTTTNTFLSGTCAEVPRFTG